MQIYHFTICSVLKIVTRSRIMMSIFSPYRAKNKRHALNNMVRRHQKDTILSKAAKISRSERELSCYQAAM